MVARDKSETPALSSQWFRAWRRVLGRIGSTSARFAGAVPAFVLGSVKHARAWVQGGIWKPGSILGSTLASVAVLAGQAVFMVLAPPGRLRTQAALTSVLLLVSLAITLVVLVAESARAHRSERVAVAAWFIGILPWAVAVTPFVWPISWVGSAVLTAALLRRSGLESRWVNRAVALAWGTQAVAAAGAWLAGNAATLMMMS